jgi:surface polysaccharide O-acyltransferase-like enzyme
MTERIRISEITLLQGFACILVVLGHSLPGELSTMPTKLTIMRDIIYSFHMPLFFSVSGYLFYAAGRPTPYFRFMKKKALRLLLPYLALSSLAFIPKVLLSRFALRPVNLSPGDFLHSLFFPQDNVIIFFWFLAALFLVFAVSPLIKKAVDHSAASEILLLVFLLALRYLPIDVQVFNLTGTLQNVIWFALGISLCKHRVSAKLSSLPILFFAFLLFPGIYCVQSVFAKNELTELALILCGIGASYSLCFTLKTNRQIESTLGVWYYQIYLLSWFAQVPFRILFQLFLWNVFIVSAMMFCMGIILPVAAAIMVKRFMRPLRPVIGL